MQPAFPDRALREGGPAPAPPLCSPRKQKMPTQHTHANFHSLPFLFQLSEKIVKSGRKNVPSCPSSEANTRLLFSFVKKNGPPGCCRGNSNSFFHVSTTLKPAHSPSTKTENCTWSQDHGGLTSMSQGHTVNSSAMVFQDTDPQLCPAAPTTEIMHCHSVLSLRTPLAKWRQGFNERQGPWTKAQAANVDTSGW